MAFFDFPPHSGSFSLWLWLRPGTALIHDDHDNGELSEKRWIFFSYIASLCTSLINDHGRPVLGCLSTDYIDGHCTDLPEVLCTS